MKVINPRRQTFQNRPLDVWLGVLLDEIARRHDDDLLRWFKIGVAATSGAIKTSDWHPQTYADVAEKAVNLVRQDLGWLQQWIWFALNTSKFWSDQSLLEFLCYQAGQCALVAYVAAEDYPTWELPSPTDEESLDEATESETEVDTPGDKPPDPDDEPGPERAPVDRDTPSPTGQGASNAVPVSSVQRPDDRPKRMARKVSRTRRRGTSK